MAYITVSFMEQLYQEHSVRIGPTIVVSPILPLDAEVFSVVKQGDVDALRRLLAEGQATLSTRDQYGRCLLNVRYIQLECYLKRANHESMHLTLGNLTYASFLLTMGRKLIS